MKKVLILLVLFISIFSFSGCSNKGDNKEESENKFIKVEANDEGKIIINTKNITSDATFINYEIDDVIIQFVVVRGTDGVVRIAFNTCQACNPSPNAYFIQKGEYLVCQNCENMFHIDKIGEEKGGCNPAPVEEKEEINNQIILDKNYIDTYKSKFKNWNGPTK